MGFLGGVFGFFLGGFFWVGFLLPTLGQGDERAEGRDVHQVLQDVRGGPGHGGDERTLYRFPSSSFKGRRPPSVEGDSGYVSVLWFRIRIRWIRNKLASWIRTRKFCIMDRDLDLDTYFLKI